MDFDADKPIEQLTPEDIQALRDAHTNAVAERDAERRRADTESGRADSLQAQVRDGSQRLAHSEVAGLSAQEQAAARDIDAITQEINGYKAQQAALFEEGKFAEAAELNEKIGDATARRQHSHQARAHYGTQRERAAAAPADPVERWLDQNAQFSEAERTWIRANPRYAMDPAFHARVNEAHAEATREGLTRGTPEYYQRLEAKGYQRGEAAGLAPPRTPRMSAAQAQNEPPVDDDLIDGGVIEEPPVQQTPPPRQAARPAARAPAAAPSRTMPSPGGQRAAGGSTRLTPEQAEFAMSMSQYFPDEVLEGGPDAIYAHFAKLNSSPTALRKREEWANGG